MQVAEEERYPVRKGREKMMDLPRAMAALGLKGLRELEDIKTGPIAVSTGFQYRTHYIEEMRSFCLHHEKKQEWYKKLPHDQKTQKNFASKNKYKKYAKYKTQMTRNELMKIHQAYQTLRARFKDKYPKVPPMATFKGAYGTIATGNEGSKGSKEKEERAKALTTTKDEAERRKKRAEHIAAVQKARDDYQVGREKRNDNDEDNDDDNDDDLCNDDDDDFDFQAKREKIKQQRLVKKQNQMKLAKLDLEFKVSGDHQLEDNYINGR